ncbi:GntR family transcriptional regulator [Lederbergia citrea]|uniref:GntR family transcriptional regulator n=1 Tax=Lederbergia citrea TaxID=2833581 RepID=UPI001BCA4C1D|nr:GntR family transcriptional regulator [Lederbergia citrea]MBS4204861.1 GntR family transcriptional regulator [Lederbergia citrea]
MNVPLYKQIYESVLEQINQGELKQGGKIPSEKDLAEQFSVSRITSKKALDLLAQENVIKRVQGKGSFVNESYEGFAHSMDHMENEGEEKLPLIGLVISGFTDDYGADLIKAIEGHAARYQAQLLIKFTYEKKEKEKRAIKELVQAGADGIIILPIHGEHYNPKILELVLNNFPIVLLDRYLRGIPASYISTDNTRAAKEATEYLMSLGHQHIAYITPSYDGTTVLEDRMKGYQLAHSQQYMQLYPHNFFVNATDLAYQMNQGAGVDKEIEEMKQFIRFNPEVTAFIVCQHSLAKILAYVIQSMKKSVPEDYSIICFDSPRTFNGKPTFTHIAQREKEMGAKAVNLLMAQINGASEVVTEVLDFDLVEGLSTAPLRKRVKN